MFKYTWIPAGPFRTSYWQIGRCMCRAGIPVFVAAKMLKKNIINKGLIFA